LAAVVVSELVLSGVREAVLSPGSRSAPLSLALHEADRTGRLRLHVRIDERTAGFLALGLAKASALPVPVVTTSGTAAANLHPAVVEADHSGVPLVVLTADRPVELRGVGANQTIDQAELYGRSVRTFVELSVDAQPTLEAQRSTVRSVLAAARRGPVHVNVALREPLVGDGEPTGQQMLPWRLERDDAPPVRLPRGPRTVLVAGDGEGEDARWLAEAAGWPLLAEPSSGARSGPNALTAYRFLVDRFADDIERVVVFGRPTLSRSVTRLLSRADVEYVMVPGRGRLVDLSPRRPLVASMVLPDWVEPGAPRVEPDAWLTRWLQADRSARRVLDEVVRSGGLSGIAVAREVAGCLPPSALLVAGSSSAIRDLDLAEPFGEQRRVLANRGASGIDGTVSTALGAALAHQAQDGGPAYALMGDLTFLHDGNGLVLGPDEARPDLTVVVVNDDGGGLFTLLEQGAPEHAAAFERVFGTPHGVDLAALCAASSTPYVRADSLEDLRQQLAPRPGLAVVEVRTDRSRTRDLHAQLGAAVAAALS